MPFSPAPFQTKGPMVVLERRYSVTIHHFIYLVFHPMKTSHFASLVIIFRNSWGNSQATSETIFGLIGKWSLGNEICWCPVTHLLSFPSDWNYPFAFGLSEVWLFAFFIWIFLTKGICGVLIFPNSYLVETAVVATVSHPSTWFQFFWFAPWGPRHGFINVFLLLFIALPPLLFSPLLLITLTSFPPSLLLEVFSFPLLLHSCHKRNQKKCLSSGGKHVQGGKKMQNITCPYFSREDLSLFYEREALPSTCTPLMYPSD